MTTPRRSPGAEATQSLRQPLQPRPVEASDAVPAEPVDRGEVETPAAEPRTGWHPRALLSTTALGALSLVLGVGVGSGLLGAGLARQRRRPCAPPPEPAPPAELLATSVRVRTLSHERQLYLSLWDRLPNGTLPTSPRDATAFGLVSTDFYDGSAFVSDFASGVVTRYDLNMQRQWLPRGRLDLSQVGIRGFTLTTFSTATRATTVFDPQNRANPRWAAWNPRTMTLLETLSVQALRLPWGHESRLSPPVPFGDRLALSIAWYQKGGQVSPNATVVLLSSRSFAGRDALQVLHDPRGLGANNAFVGRDDHLYVASNAMNGRDERFPPSKAAVPPAALLRICAGTRQFDSSYHRNLARQLDARALFNIWHLGGDSFLALKLHDDPFNDPRPLRRGALQRRVW